MLAVSCEVHPASDRSRQKHVLEEGVWEEEWECNPSYNSSIMCRTSCDNTSTTSLCICFPYLLYGYYLLIQLEAWELVQDGLTGHQDWVLVWMLAGSKHNQLHHLWFDAFHAAFVRHVYRKNKDPVFWAESAHVFSIPAHGNCYDLPKGKTTASLAMRLTKCNDDMAINSDGGLAWYAAESQASPLLALSTALLPKGHEFDYWVIFRNGFSSDMHCVCERGRIESKHHLKARSDIPVVWPQPCHLVGNYYYSKLPEVPHKPMG